MRREKNTNIINTSDKTLHKTRWLIENLQRKCESMDCDKYNCDTCPVTKRSIKLFGIDVIRL